MHLNKILAVYGLDMRSHLICDKCLIDICQIQSHREETVRVSAEDLLICEVTPAADSLSEYKTAKSGIPKQKEVVLFDPAKNICR